MPIYDNNGSVNSLIGKVYDHNGSVQSAISKVYDNNGSVNSLVYQGTEPLFDNGDQCTAITGGWTVHQSTSPSKVILGNTIQLCYIYNSRYSQGGAAATVNPIANTGYSRVAVTYSINVSVGHLIQYATFFIEDIKGNMQNIDVSSDAPHIVYTKVFPFSPSAATVRVGFRDGFETEITMTVYKVELI